MLAGEMEACSFTASAAGGWCSAKRPSATVVATPCTSIKVRILKAEVVEGLLHGCVTWNLKPNHCTEQMPENSLPLPSSLHRFWQKRERTDPIMSCAEALTKAGCCENSVDATVSERRQRFAGFLRALETAGSPRMILYCVKWRGGREVLGETKV